MLKKSVKSELKDTHMSFNLLPNKKLQPEVRLGDTVITNNVLRRETYNLQRNEIKA